MTPNLFFLLRDKVSTKPQDYLLSLVSLSAIHLGASNQNDTAAQRDSQNTESPPERGIAVPCALYDSSVPERLYAVLVNKDQKRHN